MSSKAQNVTAFTCIFIILFSHGMTSEGRRFARERKYYPEEPPVDTIVLDNGDVIDCVDFYSQPAMKDLDISRNPQLREIVAENKSHKPVNDKLEEVGRRKGSCPVGSVPFLKATKAGPLNFSAVDSFARSRADFFRRSHSIKPLNNPQKDHEYAMAFVHGGTYRGGQGTLSVWQPTLESPEEMSLVQMWVVRRSSTNMETVEAGWMVCPLIFGDYSTRFFFFTTNSSYQIKLYGEDNRTPAYNNNLRFIRQDNEAIPFGMQITPVSVYEGEQVSVKIKIQRNDYGNWDLWFNSNKIGYWPRQNYEADGFTLANEVHWGGEILNKGRRRHTSTQMGSGHFSNQGRGRAASITNMGLFGSDNEFYDVPRELRTYETKSACYDVKVWNLPNERFITVGGPGYDGRACR